MKKMFYIDCCSTILCVISLVLFGSKISSIYYVLICVLYLLFSIYVTKSLRKILKYPCTSKISFKQKLFNAVSIIGKLLFLIQIYVMVGHFNEEPVQVTVLIVFILHSYLVLDYTYIYKNKLVRLRGKPIDLDDIQSYSYIANFMDETNLNIHTKFGKSYKCYFSPEELKKFTSIKNI